MHAGEERITVDITAYDSCIRCLVWWCWLRWDPSSWKWNLSIRTWGVEFEGTIVDDATLAESSGFQALANACLVDHVPAQNSKLSFTHWRAPWAKGYSVAANGSPGQHRQRFECWCTILTVYFVPVFLSLFSFSCLNHLLIDCELNLLSYKFSCRKHSFLNVNRYPLSFFVFSPEVDCFVAHFWRVDFRLSLPTFVFLDIF